MEENTNPTNAENAAANNGTGTAGTGNGSQTAGGAKNYSQEDLDRIVSERSDRAGKAAMRSYFQQQGMTEEEANKAIQSYKATKAKELPPEAAQAIAMEKKRAEDAITQMNQRLIQAEARAQAVLLQIKPERLDYALRLADLSQIKIGTDGQLDAAKIKSALEQVIKDIPELKATEPQPAGFRVGADGGTDAESDDDALRRAFGLKPRA